LSEKASFVLGSSFTKTRSFTKTNTSHFNFKCFVIIKTSLRRSFDNQLYIISFSSSLTLNFKSKNACNRACFIWTGFAIATSSFGTLERILKRRIPSRDYQLQFFSGFELQVKERLRSCLFHLDRLCNRDFFIWDVGTHLKRHIPSHDLIFLSEGSTRFYTSILVSVNTILCLFFNFEQY
jgi:hypothetical protein